MIDNIKTLKTAIIGIALPYGLEPLIKMSVQNFADLVNSGIQFIIGVVAIYKIIKSFKKTK